MLQSFFFLVSYQTISDFAQYCSGTSKGVSCAVFTGEIVPQAICSHYGLAIGAWTAWFVRFLMIASAPISWPISKLLDYLLGSEHTVRLSLFFMCVKDKHASCACVENKHAYYCRHFLTLMICSLDQSPDWGRITIMGGNGALLGLLCTPL